MVHINPNITPSFPIDEQPTIGLIGMGAMGRMYAKYLSEAGWKKCVILNAHYTSTHMLLEFTYATYLKSLRLSRLNMPVCLSILFVDQRQFIRRIDIPGIKVFPTGHAVSRSSDFLMYSVEAEFIENVVAQYGPCTFARQSFRLSMYNRISLSYETWRYSRRANVCKSPRKDSFREISSRRRPHYFLPFPSWSYCKSFGTTIGAYSFHVESRDSETNISSLKSDITLKL